MRRTRLSRILVLSIIITFIVGGGLSGFEQFSENVLIFVNSEVYAQDTITLELAHGAPVGDPRYESMELLAELVYERTNGEVEIIIHPDHAVGSEREFIEQTQMGAIDMSLANPGGLSAFYEKWAVIDVPYLWPSQEHLRAVLDGPIAQKWNQEMIEQENMFVLAAYDRAPRNFITNVRPVQTPEDLAGIDVRVPDWPASIAGWRAFGVEPTQVGGDEQYMAFRTGVVDAIENPYTVFLHWGHYEIGDYISETEHVRQALLLTVNNDSWGALTDEQRAIIELSAKEVEVNHRSRVFATAERALQEMIEDHGLEFFEVDQEAFMILAEEIYDEFLGVLDEDEYNAIMALRNVLVE